MSVCMYVLCMYVSLSLSPPPPPLFSVCVCVCVCPPSSPSLHPSSPSLRLREIDHELALLSTACGPGSVDNSWVRTYVDCVVDVFTFCVKNKVDAVDIQ